MWILVMQDTFSFLRRCFQHRKQFTSNWTILANKQNRLFRLVHPVEQTVVTRQEKSTLSRYGCPVPAVVSSLKRYQWNAQKQPSHPSKKRGILLVCPREEPLMTSPFSKDMQKHKMEQKRRAACFSGIYTIYYSNCSPFPLRPTLMKKGCELNSNLGKHQPCHT